MAVVDLERPRYEVQEGEGRVTVCVDVRSPRTECPVSFGFSIRAKVLVGMALICCRSACVLLFNQFAKQGSYE